MKIDNSEVSCGSRSCEASFILQCMLIITLLADAMEEGHDNGIDAQEGLSTSKRIHASAKRRSENCNAGKSYSVEE